MSYAVLPDGKIKKPSGGIAAEPEGLIIWWQG